jgi:phosphoribosylanthranilate isomerase
MPLLERLPHLKGLQLVGGEEERVGLKSFDQLDEIFEQLQED